MSLLSVLVVATQLEDPGALSDPAEPVGHLPFSLKFRSIFEVLRILRMEHHCHIEPRCVVIPLDCLPCLILEFKIVDGDRSIKIDQYLIRAW